jgi:hypothetical protein
MALLSGLAEGVQFRKGKQELRKRIRVENQQKDSFEYDLPRLSATILRIHTNALNNYSPYRKQRKTKI